MSNPIFKKGDHRNIRLANGQVHTGFHSRMERRWERIQIISKGEVYFAWYSRSTGRIDDDPQKSPIVIADCGFLQSQLIEVKWETGK